MSAPSGPSRGAAALPYLIVAVLALIPFSEALVPGRVLCYRDLGAWFHPVLTQAWPRAELGSPPLWIHGVACGRPLWANPGWALASPSNLLYLVLPFNAAFDAFLMLHALLAGVAMTWLARVLGASRVAAVVAGAAYVMGGGIVSATALYWTLVALAWAPLVIGCALRALEQPSRWRFGLLTLALFCQVMGGQPEPILATLVLGFVLSIARGPSRLGTRIGRALLAWTVCGTLAALLASPLLVPAAQFARTTYRAWGFDAGKVLYNSLDPHLLPAMVLPRWLGHPMDRIAGGYAAAAFTDTRTSYFHSLDLGLVAALLAVIAVLLVRPRAMTTALAVMAALGVVIASGRFVPGVETLIASLGPLPLRYPIKALALTHLALPLLAALGADALATRLRRPRALLALPVLVVLEMAYAQHRMLPACDASLFEEPPLARELKARAAQFGAPDGQWRVHHERLPMAGPWSPPLGSLEPTEQARLAWDTRMLFPPRGAPFGIHHALEGLADLMDDQRWFTVARDLYTGPRGEWARGLGELGVLFVISPSCDLASTTAGLELETALGREQGLPEGSGYLYRCTSWVPRIRPIGGDAGRSVGAAGSVIETPYGLEVEVHADADAQVVIADAVGDLSAWTASVDGIPVPLVRTGPRGALVELRMPAGAHRVRVWRDRLCPRWVERVWDGTWCALALACLPWRRRRVSSP